MSGFTPGPWSTRNKKPRTVHADGKYICTALIGNGPPSGNTKSLCEAKANACLIAAAPTLLEALDGLVLVLDAMHETEWLNPMEVDALNAARAAIASARGDA